MRSVVSGPATTPAAPTRASSRWRRALKHEFDFRVVARDRAPGAQTSTAPRDWVDLGYAKARYLEIDRFGARGLTKLLRETPHDALWLNSVYDREFTLPALFASRARGASRAPIILSPRGEFGAGALDLKAGKKQLFLRLARTLGLWRAVTWHATSEAEAKDVAAQAPADATIAVAANLRLMLTPPAFQPPGEALRVIFVGRIVPIKGLDIALDALARMRAPVSFEIFGPEEDAATSAQCHALAESLPPHIKAHWRGAASNETIVAAMARSDLFLLPTGGENFGHAIFEALSCGVPVLISDQTPWRGLAARHAGWDLPLADRQAFVDVLEAFAAMPQGERAAWREGARACARAYVEESGAAEASATLIRRAIGSNR